MSKLQEVEQLIADTQAQIADVHGRSCEVYARIVGYYRSVANWNAGKNEEYRERQCFTLV